MFSAHLKTNHLRDLLKKDISCDEKLKKIHELIGLPYHGKEEIENDAKEQEDREQVNNGDGEDGGTEHPEQVDEVNTDEIAGDPGVRDDPEDTTLARKSGL